MLLRHCRSVHQSLWRDGSGSSSRSMSDVLSLPVRAGRNCWQMVSSRGYYISGDIPLMVLKKFVQWLARP